MRSPRASAGPLSRACRYDAERRRVNAELANTRDEAAEEELQRIDALMQEYDNPSDEDEYGCPSTGLSNPRLAAAAARRASN